MKITIKDLNKSYGKEKIFENFSIEFESGKINCILGESGCGKTTLLNIIAGLIKVDTCRIDGITKKDISYVFQEDRLIPWLTIKENLSISLKKYYSKEKLEEKINEILKIAGIQGIENRYPHELSGGMKQRINIGRALGKPSKVILMDEPFKSLDYKTKYTIINEFMKILENEKRIVVLVTHDLDEAVYFNGKIFIFGGRPVCTKGVFANELEKNKKIMLDLI
ncbi:ATP-binding cassette domain-containing protein [uncultured Clostridium sp.]|uniref:ATP-binding cassette domain-containing protein n=1 Tax=uncultured Clostridium sp. TaxID=59620 RepID=UPI0025D82535|nr:ABC transporter ATP-binding protein [uncultured Clostridium sp.]